MMSTWKMKKFRKTSAFSRGQTAGSSKGANCKATPIQRYMAKRNRSYKHRRYAEWSEKFRGQKVNANMGGV